jgi:hypothetical protein
MLVLLFTMLNVLDMRSLAHLSQATPTLHSAVEKYASVEAKSSWEVVSHG